MTLFSLLESLFFMSLALAFFLIFLMVYHFKQRIDTLDRKNEMLGDICKTLVKEIDTVKELGSSRSSFFPNTQPSFTFQSFPEPEDIMSDDYNPLQHLFAKIKQAHHLKVYDDCEVINECEVVNDCEEVNDCEVINDCEEVNDCKGDVNDREGEVKVCEVNLNDGEVKVYEGEVNDHDGEVKVCEVNLNDCEGNDMEEVLEEPLEESVWAESVMTQESVMTESDNKISKMALKKMTISMLRDFAIQEGYCTDPSKMKKKELIDTILISLSPHNIS